ncbi:MAG: hypothetical protein MHMPM18_000025 [Marteilia pararefringens]
MSIAATSPDDGIEQIVKTLDYIDSSPPDKIKIKKTFYDSVKKIIKKKSNTDITYSKLLDHLCSRIQVATSPLISVFLFIPLILDRYVHESLDPYITSKAVAEKFLVSAYSTCMSISTSLNRKVNLPTNPDLNIFSNEIQDLIDDNKITNQTKLPSFSKNQKPKTYNDRATLLSLYLNLYNEVIYSVKLSIMDNVKFIKSVCNAGFEKTNVENLIRIPMCESFYLEIMTSLARSSSIIDNSVISECIDALHNKALSSIDTFGLLISKMCKQLLRDIFVQEELARSQPMSDTQDLAELAVMKYKNEENVTNNNTNRSLREQITIYCQEDLEKPIIEENDEALNSIDIEDD